MFIGDILDRLISIVFGVIIIVMSVKPSIFIKNEDKLNKFEKKKKVMFFIGLFIVSLGTILLIFKIFR